MKVRLAWMLLAVVAAVGLSSLTSQRGAAPSSKFKNIVVLKGMTDQEIQDTMELWGKQVGLTCDDCHVQDDFATDEKHEKRAARQMYQMVEALNQQDFFKSGDRQADCYLCHRGVKYIPPQVIK